MIDWGVWWTYRPSDFLMFSPRIYGRLFESINAAWWPAAPMLALLVLAGLRRDIRIALGALAAAWALAGAAFLAQRYAPIFWPAEAWAWAFGAQALGLSALAWRARAVALGGHRGGAALLAWGLLGHPLLAPLSGRPLAQAELFGLAPDPTALATIGLLLMLRAEAPAARRLRWALAVAPLAWCAFSAATQATLWTVASAPFVPPYL